MRAFVPESAQERIDAAASAARLADTYAGRVPAHIERSLERAAQLRGPFEPRASGQSWREPLYYLTVDGAQIAATTTETIMVPDYSIPANYMFVGRVLKFTLFFDVSFVITTPGTLTIRLRWGGVGGTSLAASGAYAPDPTAAVTTRSGFAEWYVFCRAVGSSGSLFVMGKWRINDVDDASATTIQGNLNMTVIPASAPAAVTVSTVAANALSPTAQFSVATAGTQLTNHLALLESVV